MIKIHTDRKERFDEINKSIHELENKILAFVPMIEEEYQERRIGDLMFLCAEIKANNKITIQEENNG